MSEGIDPVQELVPIKPVAHYTMGGLYTKPDTRTELAGLFACGENAGNGIHGANRLGGNSLMEGVVFGKLAAEKAVEYAKANTYQPIDFESVQKDMNLIDHILDGENRYNINAIRTNLGNTLFKKVGIYRNEESLMDAHDYIKYLRRLVMSLHCVNKERDFNMEIPAILELRNALLISEVLIASAMAREESRGAHKRTDFPDKNDSGFRRHSFAKELRDGYIRVDFDRRSGAGGWVTRFKKYFTN